MEGDWIITIIRDGWMYLSLAFVAFLILYHTVFEAYEKRQRSRLK